MVHFVNHKVLSRIDLGVNSIRPVYCRPIRLSNSPMSLCYHYLYPKDGQTNRNKIQSSMNVSFKLINFIQIYPFDYFFFLNVMFHATSSFVPWVPVDMANLFLRLISASCLRCASRFCAAAIAVADFFVVSDAD